MIVKEQVKAEIDCLDEHYLELAFKIICQFPHISDQQQVSGQQIAEVLQEIADSGGLEINDPVAWQREVRQDRILPFRGE